MIWLRQSTAVTVSFGPAVLNSDGVTLVTNLTGTGANQTENTSTGIRISKNGGAFAARHATAGASTYDAFGNYLVPLDTTDTGTLGALRMQYANGAAFCPLFMDMMVVNTALWDALFASSGGAIPNVAAAGVGGLLTAPTTANVGLSDLSRILGTALTETAGLLAGGFKKFFNVPAPTGTLNSIPDAVPDAVGGLPVTGNQLTAIPAVALVTTVTNLTNAPTAGDLTATMKTSVTTAATAATPTAAAVTGAVGSVTGAVGSVTARVTANTDQLAGQTVTAAAGVTFPASVASPTNITAGTIATVTTLTNLPAIPANWLTAAGIAAAALNGKGDWNIGKTGYTLTTNVWDEVLASHLTAGSTGAALNAAGAAGDPWTTALPGAYGAGTAGNIIGNRIDLAISTRLATSGYAAPDNAGITAIKVKTDNITFTVSAQVDTNIRSVNGVTVAGDGSAGTPWGP